LEIKRNSLWLADALSIPFPRSQNKEKTCCRFARGGKIYSPVLVSKERKKQRTNECTKHSFNVANEKKSGTQTARHQNTGETMFRFFLARLCSFGVEVLKK
jgi:hypothetical protein